MIAKKKIEENCLLHGFGTQTFEFLQFLLVNKDSLYTHNQLHGIASPNIWYCWMGHIGLLGFYKLEKNYLGVKL